MGLPTCVGPFSGTCDSAIADWIGNRLSSPRNSSPQFIYWVTLNSHLPVPTPAPLPHPASCGFSSELIASPALCSWFQLETNVHQSVARLAASAHRPTLFILVGDHAPPFTSPELREQFSAEDVPYIALVPTATH
jgi:phosphoglycerol transferase MdoB-like AlkP superfamily enzyme